jgi:hypothetical protein
MVKFPEGERFQANINTFIKCLANPNNSIGNILIIQGGVKHMNNSSSYYIKTACSLLPKNLRVFIFEKLHPVCNPEFAHDVADCLTFIKKEFSGPLCVIGFSMGALLLFTYLSMGYDQADFYIPVCGPLNMDRFMDVISNHRLFKFLQNRACKSFQVKDYEGLLEFSGTSLERCKEFEKHFMENLNSHADKWIDKTVYILSENDPITSIDDLDLFERKPITYLIKGGWHCCLESILLTTYIAGKFIKDKSEGIEVNLKDLTINYGVIDIIKILH